MSDLLTPSFKRYDADDITAPTIAGANLRNKSGLCFFVNCGKPKLKKARYCENCQRRVEGMPEIMLAEMDYGPTKAGVAFLKKRKRKLTDKLVFLDIDGVLNSHRSSSQNHKAGIKDAMMRIFDPISIRELNRIIRRTDANIVISSTWRMLWSIPEIKKHLSGQGFEHSDKIIGRTPIRHTRRGLEIQEYIDDTEFTGKFVIIDDDDDMEHLMPHLVKTSFKYGLTIRTASEAIKRLL